MPKSFFVPVLLLFPFLLLLCSISAKADWPLFRGNPCATGVSEEVLPEKLDLLWEYRLEKGWFEATPIIVNGTIFLGSSEDQVLAIDLKTGQERWTFKNEVGFLSPALFCPLNEQSNSVSKPTNSASEPGSSVKNPVDVRQIDEKKNVEETVADFSEQRLEKRDEGQSEKARDLVVIGDPDGILYALNAKTGEKCWSFQANATIDNSGNFWKGHVIVGSQDGHLYALDAKTGNLLWKFASDDQIRCFPTIFEDTSFVAGCDGKLHIIDLESGTQKAFVDLEAPTGSTPVVSNDCVFFGTEGNEFLAVDWKKAEIIWRFPLKQSIRAPAAVCEKFVIFGSFDRTLYAVDPKNGEEKWTFRTKGRLEGGVIIDGDRVYFGGTDANFYVLNLETGQLVQRIELSDQVLGSPATADGRIVIATGDGVLSCFGKKETRTSQ
ncbi:MAG: PQQ-binding-like beta-propeller repeat protein [Thermoguttaceae bacterium]